MAKVSFTKLGLKTNQEIKTLEYNGQIIEIKQYLPIQEKLELISNVINLSADENNFANPVKIDAYSILEIIEYYTNINFTEKQKEDPAKLYDLIISNNLAEIIIQSIPEKEYINLLDGINECVEAIYKYRNSALGILDSIKQDYDNTSFDLLSISEQLNDGKLDVIKEIAPFLNLQNNNNN